MRGLALASAKALHEAGINFRTITINGAIREDSPFAPDRIAKAFWAAFDVPREAWVAEEIFDGG